MNVNHDIMRTNRRAEAEYRRLMDQIEAERARGVLAHLDRQRGVFSREELEQEEVEACISSESETSS